MLAGWMAVATAIATADIVACRRLRSVVALLAEPFRQRNKAPFFLFHVPFSGLTMMNDINKYLIQPYNKVINDSPTEIHMHSYNTLFYLFLLFHTNL